ncbi:MAG: enoyl-CoA hydratase/isomerase family protein [Proteobacteria bacterium]|nr:enoyl-CoA hydratase/isomerase family protein [Pseudomonadota bacterium]
MSDEVLVERRDRVLLITLNRPKAKNAVNTALAQGLIAAIDELDSDDGLTAGVLTGAGGSFSAGMDLKAFATEGPPVGLDEFLRECAKKPLSAAI